MGTKTRFEEEAKGNSGMAYCHFLEVCHGAQAVSASTSHEISHMRTRYSVLSQRPRKPEKREPGNEVGENCAFTVKALWMLACWICFVLVGKDHTKNRQDFLPSKVISSSLAVSAFAAFGLFSFPC